MMMMMMVVVVVCVDVCMFVFVFVCVCERERVGGEEVAVVRSVVGSVVGGYIVFTIPIIKCVCVFCKFGLRACSECSARFHVDISSYDAFDAPHSHRCASPQSELDLARVMILDGHIGQGIFFLEACGVGGEGGANWIWLQAKSSTACVR